jgi:protein gp37
MNMTPWSWPSNVRTGVSAENQQCFDERVPILTGVPGHYFLSLEPLLGPIDLTGSLVDVDWIIIGGESGPNARPMKLDWVQDILAQCRAANIPAFVKQLGSHWAKRVGATHSKGGDPDEWPPYLNVRMFPGEMWDA